MNLKKYDKNGKLLNLTPIADKQNIPTYYDWWIKNPDRYDPTLEDLKSELQLTALGDFELLNFNIEWEKFNQEIKKFTLVPYLRRENVSNDREGLLLVGLPNDTPTDSLSRPEAIKRAGKMLEETDFNIPTKAFSEFPSLSEILNYWNPLGRTMIIKTNAGGWFPPHRDNPHLTRDTFRIVVFLGNATNYESYEWILNNKTQAIIPNQAYYIDTRKVHRTHSWINDSYHLILNVPKTWENVIKLMSRLKY